MSLTKSEILALIQEALASDLGIKEFKDSGVNQTLWSKVEAESRESLDILAALMESATEENLEALIRLFLEDRWDRIKGSNAGYVEFANGKVNQLCERLASSIVKDDEDLVRVLMPTLLPEDVYSYVILDLRDLTEYVDEKTGQRRLATGQFMLNHDFTGIIPLQRWFDSQKGDVDHLVHFYYSNNQPVPLHEEDIAHLRSCSPPYSEDFFDKVDDIRTGKKLKGTLAEQILKLCNALRAGGKAVTGHKDAAPEVYTAIINFLKIWDGLPDSIKNGEAGQTGLKFLKVNDERDQTLESYLLVLRKAVAIKGTTGVENEETSGVKFLSPEEEERVRQENLITCVEVNADLIRLICRTHLARFSAVNLDQEKPTDENAEEPVESDLGLGALIKAVNDKLDRYDKKNELRLRYPNGYEKLSNGKVNYQRIITRVVGKPNHPSRQFVINSLLKPEFLNKIPAQDMLDLLLRCIDAEDPVMLRLVLTHGAKDVLMIKDSQGYFAIHRAAKRNNPEVIEILLEFGGDDVSTMKVNHDQMTPLLVAAARGNSKVFELLLTKLPMDRRKEQARMTDVDGYNALHFAAQNGHTDVVKILLESEGIQAEDLIGNQVNKGKFQAMTALALAAKNGHAEIVRMLLKVGGKNLALRQRQDGMTALHLAAANGHHEVAEYLLKEYGNDLATIKDNEGKTAFMLAITNSDERMVKIFLDHLDAKSLLATDKQGRNALHFAASDASPEVLSMLLESCDKKLALMKNDDGEIPLTHLLRALQKISNYATSFKSILMKIKILLAQEGVDYSDYFNKNSRDLYEYLDNAVARKDSELVKLLLRHGGKKLVITRDKFFIVEKRTILHKATMTGDPEILEALLQASGMDLALSQDAKGLNCLSLAVANKKNEVAKALLTHTELLPLISMTDREGMTALDHAVLNDDPEMVSLFFEKELDHSTLKNAFRIAFRAGRVSIVKMFLEKYPTLANERYHGGMTALQHLAYKWQDYFDERRKNCTEIMRLILDAGSRDLAGMVDEEGNSPLHYFFCIDYDQISEFVSSPYSSAQNRTDNFLSTLNLFLDKESGLNSVFVKNKNGDQFFSNQNLTRLYTANAFKGISFALLNRFGKSIYPMVDIKWGSHLNGTPMKDVPYKREGYILDPDKDKLLLKTESNLAILFRDLEKEAGAPLRAEEKLFYYALAFQAYAARHYGRPDHPNLINLNACIENLRKNMTSDLALPLEIELKRTQHVFNQENKYSVGKLFRSSSAGPTLFEAIPPEVPKQTTSAPSLGQPSSSPRV